MSLWLEAPAPDISPDSATELWKAETQDARNQGGDSCILREEARMPQSAGGAIRMDLEAAQPTALLPRAGTFLEPTGVLSEEQIRLKKLKRQEEEQAQAASASPRVSSPPPALPQLSPEQLGMIEKLVAAQQQCNRRSFSDRLRVTPWPVTPDPQSREARQQRFAHFTELAIVSVQEIVDFAKQLPGFLQLSREDQIALLKTSAIEVMLLETSRRYNPGSESITFLKDFSYNREDFAKAGLQVEFINPIFEFSRAMNELQLNDAEFALLIAISIFSADRPNVQDQLQVERLQHTYVEALHAYVSINHPHDRLMFPRMLMKLVSLRTLSSVHSEQVFALRLQDKKLPPLLSEIWDVHE
ncbi:oxysterols receptor LXR-alpha isoform X2 [Meriones unguiculatus]|uniref:oxysterols receptor LXR-alpha isoform X2 n=1 Tax=Meriones unguiculatus TaxID=10047 RepID=UPI000B4F355C|nr:oxysterols receptor LXR-alpha isoform X3 [Meriones unguiculatus]XP_060227972.1 oxysterols receptor LXR-alpha isoform X2 [Meriones unguiculatus]